jgi:hypothetical protein
LLLAACPPVEGTTASGTTDATDATDAGTGTDAGTTPTTGEMPTTGETPVECVGGGIGVAFAWTTAPDPGVAQCTRISDDTLAFDCTGDFTGIFTLELANSGTLGIVAGDPLEVDYRVTKDGDTVTGEWLRVRDQVQWYIVAGQGPTVAPANAPDDWFHPNVDVTVVATDCAAVACDDGSGDENIPGALAFGEGEQVVELTPGKGGGVPGEFGGESYHAVVTEAHTGLCGGGDAKAGVALYAYSVVSSGFI